MKKELQTELYIWIGKEIASFRKVRDLSQIELAELLDVSRGSIANIEKGRQQAPLHLLYDIADQLNVPINKLLPPNNEHIHNHLIEIKKQLEQLEDLESENKNILTQFFKKNID